jgi:hypothetical protein
MEPAATPPFAAGVTPLTESGPLPAPRFDHLRLMTSPMGLWEHARLTTPRPEHGYCTDDNARGLTVLSRQGRLSPDLAELAHVYLRFLQEAALSGGGFHNRRRADGSWADVIGSDDSQGRAIWGLGSAVQLGSDTGMGRLALNLFERQRLVSDSPRANAFAILGAAEVTTAVPGHRVAMEAMEKCAIHLRADPGPRWPWPEARLSYDNARIPEALMAAGDALGDVGMTDTGLRLLEWLVSVETNDDRFTFTPVGGWAMGEPRPGFDQQPVEAAAMADACARAWFLTGEPKWRAWVLSAARWLIGANDRAVVLYDAQTGGCCDGLTAAGVNLNQGAESTLAALSTLQQAHRVF